MGHGLYHCMPPIFDFYDCSLGIPIFSFPNWLFSLSMLLAFIDEDISELPLGLADVIKMK